uniref:Bcr/CflA family efflux transporter n=1 Tax=uncultured Thiotrichaceae bacterium TaxID=298394 RepID=A0A6S6UFU1_9GAMM|nr:MAG: Bcr/CflA family efflux transporter [uncultured Thiotrichaceae bacterium]
MNKPTFPSIWLLSTIALASPFAMNVFNPAMPDVVRAFGSRIEIVQLTMVLYLFALGISQLASGMLADRFGRRPLMLGGMVLHLVGTIVAALAVDIEILIAGRVLQALGGGATLVLVRTMILDAHGRNEAGKYLSYIAMSIAVAQTLAPTIGGYLNHYFSWRAIFYFSLLMNLGITLLMFRQLRETNSPAPGATFALRPVLQQYAAVLKSPVYVGYALTGALATAAYLGFASVMPYIFVDQMGGTSAEYGNWFLLVSLGFFTGSLVASRLTVRLGLDRMINSGFALALLAASVLVLLMLMLAEYVVAGLIFALMGVLTFGRGLLQGSAQSGAISSLSGSRGTASGMMGFMQLMIAAAVTQIMPVLLELGVVYVFLAILGLVIASGVMHTVAVRAEPTVLG